MHSALGHGVTGLQGSLATGAISPGVLSGLPEMPGSPCSQRVHVDTHLADATVTEQSKIFLMNSKSRKEKKKNRDSFERMEAILGPCSNSDNRFQKKLKAGK